MFPLPAWWDRKRPLWYPPPVVVSFFSTSNIEESSTDRSRTVPLDYWGASQSGPFTDRFYSVSAGSRPPLRNTADTRQQESVQPSYQPSTGPTRTGLIPTRRFQPYGMSYARANERGYTEAGPLTLVPLPIPYGGPPTLQTSGGISETTADAETKQTVTEEDKTPVSSFYCSHIPRVTEWTFGVRRPTRPGAPAAKGNLAATADRRRKMPKSYATGCSGEKNSQKFRALTRLWPVSVYRIS